MLIYSNKEIAKKNKYPSLLLQTNFNSPSEHIPFCAARNAFSQSLFLRAKKKQNYSDFHKGRNLKFNQSLGYVLLKGKKHSPNTETRCKKTEKESEKEDI